MVGVKPTTVGYAMSKSKLKQYKSVAAYIAKIKNVHQRTVLAAAVGIEFHRNDSRFNLDEFSAACNVEPIPSNPRLLTAVGNFTVSTLKPFDKPYLWETCLFREDSMDSEVVAEYTTWDAAINGHNAIVCAIQFTQGVDNVQTNL